MKMHNINIHIHIYIVTNTDDSYPWKLAKTWSVAHTR